MIGAAEIDASLGRFLNGGSQVIKQTRTGFFASQCWKLRDNGQQTFPGALLIACVGHVLYVNDTEFKCEYK